MPRFLYAGYLSKGQLSEVRLSALRAIGVEALGFDMEPYYEAIRRNLLLRLTRRVRGHVDMRKMNEALLRACAENEPDVLYVDKGIGISRETLLHVRADAVQRRRRMVQLHFHPDDAFHPRLATRTYEAALSQYDCHFIPHRWVMAQHLERGARKVVYLPFGYDPGLHFREPAVKDEPGAPDVVFVGRWEKERARWLSDLSRMGFRVDVWGPWWERELRRGGPNLVHRSEFASFQDQRRAYTSARISLGLLSATNRDGHTSRTFEVPACGGFMIAERTSGQREFFQEGKEMVCFEGFPELAAKVRHYLDHPSEREEIREAGYKRCLSSGYDYGARMKRVLEEAQNLLDA